MHHVVYAAERGYKDLVDFFIQKGANWWDQGMYYATRGVCKQKGANWWNQGIYEAAMFGHRNLVNFFLKKGAYIDDGMIGAIIGKHEDLIAFFKQKIYEKEFPFFKWKI